MQKLRRQGLVADLWPILRILQTSGMFFSVYHENNTSSRRLVRKIYSWVVTIFLVTQYLFLVIYVIAEAQDADERASYSVTILLFTLTLIKWMYVSSKSEKVGRTLAMWDNPNMHPLFTESNARFRASAITRVRALLSFVAGATIFSTISWTIMPFIGDSTRQVPDPEVENGTMIVEVPRLLLVSWYPFDVMHGVSHGIVLVLQIYYVFLVLGIGNLCDTLFNSMVIVSCEQLRHLKDIMEPLIKLSSTLDTAVPNASTLFRIGPPTSRDPLLDENDFEEHSTTYQNYRDTALTISDVGGAGEAGLNGLTRKQEILVRTAVKYWVERHKYTVKYVEAISNTYGMALLFHMLIVTLTMTLLAYQATQINGVNKFAFSTIGYLVYSLAQVYLLSTYSNELTEESSSIMEAAYGCSWHDGSREAKSFVQIVCQHCQKALQVTGAKFFIVNLDLFTSVLGAVVTYYILLLKLG